MCLPGAIVCSTVSAIVWKRSVLVHHAPYPWYAALTSDVWCGVAASQYILPRQHVVGRLFANASQVAPHVAALRAHPYCSFQRPPACATDQYLTAIIRDPCPILTTGSSQCIQLAMLTQHC